LPVKKPITLIPKVPFQNRWNGGGILEGELTDPGLPEKMVIKQK